MAAAAWASQVKAKARAPKWATDTNQHSVNQYPIKAAPAGPDQRGPKTIPTNEPVHAGRARVAAESQNKSPGGDWLQQRRNASKVRRTGPNNRPTEPKTHTCRHLRGGARPSRTGRGTPDKIKLVSP